jgi:hypothetical protein
VALQGQTVTLSVSGYPPDDDPLKSLVFEIPELGTYDSNPITQLGSVSFLRRYVIPAALPNGPATVRARVRTRDGAMATATDRFMIRDDDPPHFVLTTWPDTLHPGDTLHTYFEAVDNVRVKYALFRLAGAYSRQDSLFVGAPGLAREWPFPIPPTPANGSSIVVSAYAVDYLGNSYDSVLATIPYVAP